jgi:anthranilate synthase/aminodeoxychorismate synthase-like glutamine amidotransferase
VRVLIVDNYDSFTFNLAQGFESLGATVEVHRNDRIDLAGVRAAEPDRVVLSPGPGHPANARDFGVCAAIVDAFCGAGGPPLLGVCLGHQGIAHRLGGRVVRAPTIVHGKPSPLRHDGRGLFAGLPDGVPAMRYHSFIVERSSLPACLEISAETDDGLIMAMRHRSRPVVGLQFHPESIGTPDGQELLRAFLEAA